MTYKNDYTISSVARALKILKLFDEDHRQMSLTEISNLSGVNKSSVLRVLDSLESEGFIRRAADSKKYKLGIELFRLGNSGYEFMDLKNVIHPYVKKAVDKTGMLGHVAILAENKILVLSRIWPEHCDECIPMAFFVGGGAPVHCTAAGKILSAYADPEVRGYLLDTCDYHKFTERTITTRSKLAQELDLTQQRGYAVNDEEHGLYLKGIAYPVMNYHGQCLAAVTLTGLKQAVENTNEQLIHQAMRDMVTGISSEVRYYNG